MTDRFVALWCYEPVCHIIREHERPPHRMLGALDVKHFLVEATYTAPLEKIREVTPEHRAFLQKGYDLGWFLCSGPQDPPVGGYLVARAPSMAALESLLSQDPFRTGELADYKIREFQPVKRQAWAEEWFTGESGASAAIGTGMG